MLRASIRFALIGIAILALAWAVYAHAYEVSALIGLLVAYLFWSYFKHGTVALAAKAYHNKDLGKAEQLLKEIRNPDRLARNRRGYYEFMLGNIELQKQNFAAAETHFQIASRFPLKNQNDKGIVLVQLANLNLRKKEFEKAEAYINVAKELKISARVQSIVQKIELEIQKTK